VGDKLKLVLNMVTYVSFTKKYQVRVSIPSCRGHSRHNLLVLPSGKDILLKMIREESQLTSRASHI
jgi:hypothetical protein